MNVNNVVTLEPQKSEQRDSQRNSYIGSLSISVLVLLLSIPVITGYTTFLNKSDGLLYGSIGTIISVILIYIMYNKITEGHNLQEVSYVSSSAILLVIIIASIVFVNRH